jgi:hypothetical protein
MAEGETLGARLRALEKSIKEQPLKALGIGAAAGFVVGGGLRSRVGASLLLFVGKVAMREMALSAVSGAVNKHDRSGKDRGRSRPRATRSESDARAGESKGRGSRNSAHPA